MKRRCLFLFFAVCFLSFGSIGASDIYQWTDEDGVIHFSDQPPEDAGIKTEVTTSTGLDYNLETDTGQGNLPPENEGGVTAIGEKPDKQSKIRYPKVEIYSTSWCKFCTQARNFFTSRKIPFTEYDIEKDREAAKRMKKMTKRNGVPFVVIGEKQIQGYSEAMFIEALDAQRKN